MLDRLSRGDKLAAGGALILLVSLFMPWYGLDLGEVGGDDPTGLSKLLGSVTVNAFDASKTIAIVLLLVAVAVVAVLFLMANGNLDDSLRSALESVGGFATLAVVFRMVDQPGNGAFVALKVGIYVAVLGALAIAVGGFLNRKDGVV